MKFSFQSVQFHTKDHLEIGEEILIQKRKENKQKLMEEDTNNSKRKNLMVFCEMEGPKKTEKVKETTDSGSVCVVVSVSCVRMCSFSCVCVLCV